MAGLFQVADRGQDRGVAGRVCHAARRGCQTGRIDHAVMFVATRSSLVYRRMVSWGKSRPEHAVDQHAVLRPQPVRSRVVRWERPASGLRSFTWVQEDRFTLLTLPTAKAGGFFLQPARLRRALANTAVEAFCPEAFAVLLLPVSACPAVRLRTATMSSAAARILRAAL